MENPNESIAEQWKADCRNNGSTLCFALSVNDKNDGLIMHDKAREPKMIAQWLRQAANQFDPKGGAHFVVVSELPRKKKPLWFIIIAIITGIWGGSLGMIIHYGILFFILRIFTHVLDFVCVTCWFR